jgi:hypothetical protein
VRTPLGLSATVLGVRYEQPGQKESGRLWVRYENDDVAPLEPKQAAGSLSQLGYRQCAEAERIRAAVAAQEAEAAQQEEQQRRVEEVQRLLGAGEPVPEHLLPAALKTPAAPAGKKGAKEGGGNSKKGGKK